MFNNQHINKKVVYLLSIYDIIYLHILDSKLHDQKRFMRDSTDLTEGEELTLHCPVLDKLKATITWSFVDGTLRSDRILTDIGDKVENGKITIADVKVEDRGRYSCTAVWYSGQATFKHLVRVKSKYTDMME